jgi:hypothetical protein
MAFEDDRMREQDRATAEAFADPEPGDRFHEMYSWWVVVVEAGAGGVKVMCAGGPTNVTRGRFPDGEIVEPFADRAQVRWYATADDFRAAYAYGSIPGYSVTLADRGKIDVVGWLERAKSLPDAPTDPKPPPDAAAKAFGILRDLEQKVARLKPSDARRVLAAAGRNAAVAWRHGSDRAAM